MQACIQQHVSSRQPIIPTSNHDDGSLSASAANERPKIGRRLWRAANQRPPTALSWNSHLGLLYRISSGFRMKFSHSVKMGAVQPFHWVSVYYRHMYAMISWCFNSRPWRQDYYSLTWRASIVHENGRRSHATIAFVFAVARNIHVTSHVMHKRIVNFKKEGASLFHPYSTRCQSPRHESMHERVN